MTRHWVDYREGLTPGPMTCWVHRRVEDARSPDAIGHEPPLPRAVPSRGHARFDVEFDGFTFEFASLDEMRHCIAVLGERLLPTSIRLSRHDACGPNSHWLSRLPARVMPWRYRERAVAYLQAALADFEDERETTS